MNYKTFSKIVSILETEHNRLSILYKQKVDLTNFVDPYHTVITELLISIYGNEGYGWFSWFCDENDFGKGNLTAYDEHKNRICYDVRSTWEFLEEYYKSKN